jgi:PAS domain S-box-containing protein
MINRPKPGILTRNSLDPIVAAPHRTVFVRFCLWMLILGIVLFTVFALLYNAEVGNNRSLRMASAWQSINLSVQFIGEELSHAVSDLVLLTRQNELAKLLEGDDSNTNRQLAKQFRALLATHRVYDQARFIGADGMEVVRVNYNKGDPVRVQPDKLQDKSDRYYFRHTIELEPGKIYLSPFDLNQEFDALELPEKPVLRFSTKVGDASDHKVGIVILNYLGDRLIEAIINAGKTSGGTIWLVNDAGYWLKGPSSDHEWSFMYKERGNNTIAHQYPRAWQQMQASEEGQILTESTLITFLNVYPHILATKSGNPSITAPDNYRWTLVSAIPESVLQADNKETRQRLLSYFGLMLIFISPVAWLLSRFSIREKTFANTMATILNNVPVLIAYIDSNRHLRFNNSAYARFFNTDVNMLHDHSLVTLIGEKGYEDIRHFVDQALEGEQVNFQQRVWFNDVMHVVAATYLPDVNSDGSVRGFIAVINDITELYNAQESDKQRLFELAHVQRVNSMGEMATEIAHEINQPLTSISMFSAACERTIHTGNWDTEQLLEWIIKIRDQAKRASEVVHRLRSFLKKGETEYEPVDINVLIRDVVSWMESDMIKLNILVSIELEDGMPDVLADAILLEQVILNLIRNAIESLSEKQDGTRQIKIESRSSDQWLEVLVSDSGAGIPKEISDQIFYSFVTSKDQGLGMGLSVSRSIVEAHGGRLFVDPSISKMTTFKFTIPITQNNSNE